MAKTGKHKPAFASLNPDDMIASGLPTDFRGTVIAADFVKFDYDGAIDEPVLAARLTIRPAEGEDVEDDVVQHWSAGDLKNFVPADEDGDEQDEGEYAMRVGKKAEMSKSSNYAQLMGAVIDCGTAAKGKPFTTKNLTGSIYDLIGLDAQWDRVPQKKRSGMVDLDEDEGGEKKKSNKDILVVTEVFGYDPDAAAELAEEKPKKKSSKPAKEADEDEDEDEAPAKKPAKKPAKPAKDEDEESEDEEQEEESEESEDEESEDESPLDADLAKAIKKAIVAAGGSLKRGKLSQAALKAFATDKRKKQMVERVTEEDFLSGKGRPWEYDEDTGVLTVD